MFPGGGTGSLIHWENIPLVDKNLQKLQICFLEYVEDVEEVLFS
jgi:hypothetical protein